MPRQFLSGHVPAVVRGLNSIGRLSASKQLNLAIGLPLRNQAGLDDLLKQIYDPSSPNYHQYLTPERFTERFGPTEEDYQAVIDFATANGLTVTGRHPNRVVLDVSGTVASIEQAFHVTLHTYQHPQEARIFYAPDGEPSVDLATPILQISGLDNYSLPHPMSVKKNLATTISQAGSGPSGTYMGNDFRAAYVSGVTETGVGQSVALVQFDGYVSNDIVAYENKAGLPRVSLVNVPVNGGVSVPSSDDIEVCLDIEMVISMAPGISNVILYEAPNGSTSWPTMLSRIADDNLAEQIGCSWGNNSPGSPDLTSEQIFKQMSAQGQSFFNATGDSDAFTSGIPFPSESTNIVQVGATTLTTGASGSWASETVWNWGLDQGSYVGSSGGISANFTIPVWQQGIDMSANNGSTIFRNVPDVALVGDNVFVIADTNKQESVGGTSCAAPLWAGFTALINQRAAANGLTPVGFLNPALYTIGKGASYTNCFHDTTAGNNFSSSSPAKFAATTGYDLCTGWGTPNGSNLIDALAGGSDILGITPATGFTSKGPIGGPFNVTSKSYSLTNSGGISLDWSLLGVPPWLDVSSMGGTLLPGSSTTLNVNLNFTAGNLPAGIYNATLSFSNLTTGSFQTRILILQVGQSLIQNGGFESGDFSSWTLVGSGANDNLVDDSSVTGITPHSGTYVAALGEPSKFAYLSQTLPTVPGQSYLLSFWLINPVGVSFGKPEQFFVNWITNSSSSNTVFNLVGPRAFGWTNMLFTVTALKTNTVLQFGFINNPNWFGLDDVTLFPVPIPTFQAVVATNGALQFTWSSLSNVAYQVQYSTNLAPANWINLGNIITATNNTTTASDFIGTDPQRFYRVRRLP